MNRQRDGRVGGIVRIGHYFDVKRASVTMATQTSTLARCQANDLALTVFLASRQYVRPRAPRVRFPWVCHSLRTPLLVVNVATLAIIQLCLLSETKKTRQEDEKNSVYFTKKESNILPSFVLITSL